MAEVIRELPEDEAPTGAMGQKQLARGRRIALRLWEERPADGEKEPSSREYETVGYVLEGRAELYANGETHTLAPGDSWCVPAGLLHTYTILEPFKALEATTPAAQDVDEEAA